jgi:L-histidine N-alpha-methyltransferase
MGGRRVPTCFAMLTTHGLACIFIKPGASRNTWSPTRDILAFPKRLARERDHMPDRAVFYQNEQNEYLARVDPAFRRDVLNGLACRPRTIPARWFYDRAGSELFEAITELPEYYVGRTERALLHCRAGEIAALTGPGRAIVEFGSGSCAKTPILLSAMKPSAYVPIDISSDFLWEAAGRLSRLFPAMPLFPVEGDFTRALRLPSPIDGLPRLGFFPGSTIGNLLVPDAVDLLRSMATTLGRHSMLLIGIDRIKDTSTLLTAYNDAQGVTAAFNLNLLHRINRELGGSVPVDAFRHVALWNDDEARIEMHLEATRDVDFDVAARCFSMTRGETIHTENSLKYGPRDARVLLRAGGWSPVAAWEDQNELFSLILAAAGPSLEPCHPAPGTGGFERESGDRMWMEEPWAQAAKEAWL